MSVLQGFQNAKTENTIGTRRQMSEMKKSYFYGACRIQVDLGKQEQDAVATI